MIEVSLSIADAISLLSITSISYLSVKKTRGLGIETLDLIGALSP